MPCPYKCAPHEPDPAAWHLTPGIWYPATGIRHPFPDRACLVPTNGHPPRGQTVHRSCSCVVNLPNLTPGFLAPGIWQQATQPPRRVKLLPQSNTYLSAYPAPWHPAPGNRASGNQLPASGPPIPGTRPGSLSHNPLLNLR